MRATYPHTEGTVDRDGLDLYFEVYGTGDPTIVLIPTWCIFHSRSWKMQIPYLSLHFRVVTWDPRGNGRSGRPKGSENYSWRHHLDDLLAVMDATETRLGVLVGLSMSGLWAGYANVLHPDRVLGTVAIGPPALLDKPLPERTVYSYTDELDTTEGWAKDNVHFIRSNYQEYIEWWSSQIFSDPHSTKPYEDGVGWAAETDGETLIASDTADLVPAHDMAGFWREMRQPALIIHGTADAVINPEGSRELARLSGATLVELEGCGHAPNVRDPGKVNPLIKSFVDGLTTSTPEPHLWTRGMDRNRKALYLSSPIGLGHARRDVAIVKELKELLPDLDIEWLAQHPVTTVLAAEKETIHPASEYLASESAHIASESAGNSLHCFQALRRMDEILIANFMVFQEVVEEGLYDLVIGDEAWDVDYYWHENPELKRSDNVWLTDFVGYLPMPAGGDREAYVTADYNAEMIEHIARFPRIRDRAIFVGNPDDIIPETFGPGLPKIRDWTEDNFTFSGYITGFEPPSQDETLEWRDEFGYRPDEKVGVVTVGGSGVGSDLLNQVIAAYPLAKDLVPELRMVAVAGPRIDPESLPHHEGLEVRGYVDRLYRHLAVCDLGVVQGGLTTTMELAAAKRPFLYFPLRDHFEQNYHVRFRLDRYGAGQYMDYDISDPDTIAEAIAKHITTAVDYRDVETDGAARAATMIADLI